MKKLFTRLMCFLPILWVLFIVNYVIDAGTYFGKNSNSNIITEILLDGDNVLMTPTFNSRIVKRNLLLASDTCDLIVLGSSRAWPIGKLSLPGIKCLNLTVPMGSLVDYLAFCELMIRTTGLPKQILIVPDLWIFDASHKPYMESKDHFMDYRKMQSRLNLEHDVPRASRSFYATYIAQRFRAVKMAFSFVYFQKTLAKLYSSGFALDVLSSDYVSAQKTDLSFHPDIRIMYPDGSQVHSLRDNEASTEMAYENVMRFLRMGSGNTFPLFLKFNTISSMKINIFQKLIKLLLDQGCDVKMLIVPNHPVAYNMMLNDSRSRIILEVEREFRELSSYLGISYYGSFDPSKMDLGEEMFIDAIHPKDDFYTKTLSKIYPN